MGKRDLTIVATAVKPEAAYNCLLTGEPCDLVPVTLRRMIIFPPIWIGWQAIVVLPLRKSPALAIWQYLRMLRPWVVFLTVLTAGLNVRIGLDPKPGSLVSHGVSFAVVALTILLWIALGRLLDRFEFVRLLRYSKSAGTVTIRFVSESVARDASQVLVLAGEHKAVSE